MVVGGLAMHHHVPVHHSPFVMVGPMGMVGMRVHKWRGHRAHRHRETHEQNQDQTFHESRDCLREPPDRQDNPGPSPVRIATPVRMVIT